MGGKIAVFNSSRLLQAVSGKEFVAEAYPVVDPDNLPGLQPTEVCMLPPALTWKDIVIDPGETLTKAARNSFARLHERFSVVFQDDLPRYNGVFGRVEAVVNIAGSLPPPLRAKSVPWYPRKHLVQLQEYFDQLEARGVFARPQDMGIDVEVVSPSFLVAKAPPSSGFRLVTNFGALASHVKNPPVPMQTTNQVLRRLSAWRYIIQADITKSYHQIPVAKKSIKYCGVSTPFKGIRVYLAAAMGMPGSEGALQELTAAVFGQLVQDGNAVVIMDDVFFGADTPEELLNVWERALERCMIANIRLGPAKIKIAPTSTRVLGWIWKQGGILQVDPHFLSRLQECDPPNTAEGLRSWIGTYKFLAPTIADHARYLEPLNAAVGDRSKSDPIVWTEELDDAFQAAKKSLEQAQPLTMPKPGEQLYMTADASQKGLGATLHRHSDKAVIQHFSKQLSADKKRWLPCELEALAVGAGLKHFLHFFRESDHRPVIYTDSVPVVLAYKRMQRGDFSSSPRVSTFLHEVLNQGAEVRYLKGPHNLPADHASRNPTGCHDPRCQVCLWVNQKERQVVRRMSPEEVNGVLAGSSPMPFKSREYWRRRQMEDHNLRRVAQHLKHGTSPLKDRNAKTVRRYLQPSLGVSLSDDNILIAPSVKEFSDTPRFVVPQAAAMTVVAIFHQQFGCLAATPLKELLRRHFLILDLDHAVQTYVDACITCAAMKDQRHVKPDMSSVPPPSHFGEHFAADVIKRARQNILLLRETATSYTWATFVNSEKANALEVGLRFLFSQIRPPNAIQASVCRVDNAKGFVSLSNNCRLEDIGVTLDLSNPANKNGNPVAERAISELSRCIRETVPSGRPLTESELAAAVAKLNSKPRWSNLAAVELWTGRDMYTGQDLLFSQEDVIQQQHKRRLQSHPQSNPQPEPAFSPGDIVFCNREGSKLKQRDKLVIRERLDNGMYKLDRLHEDSGRITRAYLPARELFKPRSAISTFPEEAGDRPGHRQTDDDEEEAAPDQRDKQQSTAAQPETRAPPRKVPPAPGHAAKYKPTLDGSMAVLFPLGTFAAPAKSQTPASPGPPQPPPTSGPPQPPAAPLRRSGRTPKPVERLVL